MIVKYEQQEQVEEDEPVAQSQQEHAEELAGHGG